MSEESTTSDLVELVRFQFAAFNRRDFDAVLEFYASNAHWRGTVDDADGIPAIRDLWVSYLSAFEELDVVLDDVVDLGNGVVLVDSRHLGRLVGGATLAEERAFVYEFVDCSNAKAT